MAGEPAPLWLSTQAAAEELGLGQRTLYRLIDRGHLPAYRFGRVIRLRRSDLEQFIESARIPTGAASLSAENEDINE